jgi:small-conductance mechanosensitive channel
MSTSKAVKQPATSHDRTSEVQLNLQYAQRVAAEVKARRRAVLQRRISELNDLPVTHPVDISLRDDLLREVRAELKSIDE